MPTELTRSYRVDPAELPEETVIFGRTSAMREIRSMVEKAISSDLPVLIQGESGTGKDLLARFLHARSSRHAEPFVRLNCAAVPDLVESELFGYQKGSFAGAREDRPGLIEIADGGTLFLDEIGELHFSLQAKLLQLLRDRTFSRIGGREKRVGQIRVFGATNIDLQAAVQAGVFREDLFTYIESVSLRLLPLRERKTDIPQLCEYFLHKLARQFGRRALRLDPTVLQLLMEWDWPGNLRELENWIARAIILGDTEILSAELKRRLGSRNYSNDWRLSKGSIGVAIHRPTAQPSSALILKMLRENRWDRRKAAGALRISYRSLLYKLRGLGKPHRPARRPRGFPPR